MRALHFLALDSLRFGKVFHLHTLHILHLLDVHRRLRLRGLRGDVRRYRFEFLVAAACLVKLHLGDIDRAHRNAEVALQTRLYVLFDCLVYHKDFALQLHDGNAVVRGNVCDHALCVLDDRVADLRLERGKVKVNQAVQFDEFLAVRNLKADSAAHRHGHGVIQKARVGNIEERNAELHLNDFCAVYEVDFRLKRAFPAERQPHERRKHGEVCRLNRFVIGTGDEVLHCAVFLRVDEHRHLAVLHAKR